MELEIAHCFLSVAFYYDRKSCIPLSHLFLSTHASRCEVVALGMSSQASACGSKGHYLGSQKMSKERLRAQTTCFAASKSLRSMDLL